MVPLVGVQWNGAVASGAAPPKSVSAKATSPTRPADSASSAIPFIDITSAGESSIAAAPPSPARTPTPSNTPLGSPSAAAAAAATGTGSSPRRLPRRDTALPTDTPRPLSPAESATLAPTDSAAVVARSPSSRSLRTHSPPLVLNLVINCSCRSKVRRKVLKPREFGALPASMAPTSPPAKKAAATQAVVGDRARVELSNSVGSEVPMPALAEPLHRAMSASGSLQTSLQDSLANTTDQSQLDVAVSGGAELVPQSLGTVDAELLEYDVPQRQRHDDKWAALALRILRSTFPHLPAAHHVIGAAPAAEDLAALDAAIRAETTAMLGQLEAMVFTTGRSIPAGARVKPLGWALRLISGFMAGKLEEDLTRTFEKKPIRTCHEYLMVFLRQTYGTQLLVEDAALQLVVVIYRHVLHDSPLDPRIALFARFLCGAYSERTLNFVLRLGRVAAEATVGPEYDQSTAAADDHATAVARISFMRVVFVVDAVLAEKPYRSALLRLCWRLCRPVGSDGEYKMAMLRGVHHTTNAPVALIPKSWTDADKAMSRAVMLRGAFLAVAAHFEAALCGEAAPAAEDVDV